MSSSFVFWNGRNDVPFLFVDPCGVEKHMRIIAPFDASYLHGAYTTTVGDVRISYQDFRQNVDAIIEREGSVHSLLRSMYAEGASARDIAIFADVLHRNDVAVAQPLSDVDIEVVNGTECVRFSSNPGLKVWLGRCALVFGDGVDDDAVDACIIARAPHDLIRVTLPDGGERRLPIGRRIVSALIASLRAVDSDALRRIAIAGPMRVDAIPEALRASVELRIQGAYDISTVRPAMGPYRRIAMGLFPVSRSMIEAFPPESDNVQETPVEGPVALNPVSVSMYASIVVVRHATGETVIEVPVMVDMALPTYDMSLSRRSSQLPSFDDVEYRFRNQSNPVVDFVFILSHDADRIRRFTSLTPSQQVLELANIFRRDIRNLAEATTHGSKAERHLTGETVYMHFPLALYAISHWTVDDDVSLADVEAALRRGGIELVGALHIGQNAWRLRISSAGCGERVIVMQHGA